MSIPRVAGILKGAPLPVRLGCRSEARAPSTPLPAMKADGSLCCHQGRLQQPSWSSRSPRMGRFSRAIDASSLHPNRDEEYADGSGAGSRLAHAHAVGGWSATVQIEKGLVGEGPPLPRGARTVEWLREQDSCLSG